MVATLALPTLFTLFAAQASTLRPKRPVIAVEVVSDRDLVVRARQGDPRAEEAFYRRHVQYVGGIAARILRNASDTEDVVQETFTVALEQLDKLRDPDALRPWLAQIAVRLVRKRMRHRRLFAFFGADAKPDETGLETMASDGASPEVHAELAALDRVLSTLPLEERIAWTLRYVENHSLEEVAAACECSLATAKRRISAAHARICFHVSIREVSE